MEIILMEKVVNLGQLGDIVKVKDGYARNFLIPQGKAKRATEANRAEFEARRAELERAQAEFLKDAESRSIALQDVVVEVAQKAGVDGRLFGSVTNADIVESLAKQGHTVKKTEVRMPQGPLKMIGEHEVVLALHTDVVVTVKVNVVPEA
jgi:large subunit ribosomal protein L9